MHDTNGGERSLPAEPRLVPGSAAHMVDQMPDRLNSCQPEEISITKVSRGERRFTFPNEVAATRLLLLAIAQVEEFTADAFFTLAEQTAW